MKIRALLFSMLIALVSSTVVFAQDEESSEPTFTISGSVDTYFHTKLNTDVDAPSTSFANLKGFSLGMANIVASYSGEKSGFVADLVFGPRGEDAVFNSPYYAWGKSNVLNASSQIVNQLYAYWKPTESLTLTLGNFNTFLGYEVISPAVNFHYSTSYMFSWGPFSHTGIKGNLEFGDGMNVLLAVMNPTDLTEFNPVSTYTLGGQFGYTNDNGGIWFNLLYGDQDGDLEKDGPTWDSDGDTDPDASFGKLFQFDITTGWNLSETFYLGVNATYQTTDLGETASGDVDGDNGSFMGVALYPKLTLSESFALGLRAEYFSVKNGQLSGVVGLDGEGNGSVIAATLSGNYTIGSLTLIPELRLDNMSEEFFSDEDEFSTSLATFNLAAVYKF